MSARRQPSWRSTAQKLITGSVMYIDGGYHIID
jgi:enoyl-[acyl-carrier-protein] reductase (NADH)